MTILLCMLGLLATVSPAEPAPRVEDAAYNAAVVAALHHFATNGEAEHVRAILDKHPDLVNVQTTPQTVAG